MPLPMNSTANRLGMARVAPARPRPAAIPARAGAMATPAPRSRKRRENAGAAGHAGHCGAFSFTRPARVVAAPFGQELGAGDDALHQRAEAVALGGQPGAHLPQGALVGQHEPAAERVAQQLATDVVEEVVLAMGAQMGAQARQPLALAWRAGRPRTSRGCPPAVRPDPRCAARRWGRSPRRPARRNRSARGSRRRPCSRGAGPASRAGSGRPSCARRWAGPAPGRAAPGCARPAPGAPPSSRA